MQNLWVPIFIRNFRPSFHEWNFYTVRISNFFFFFPFLLFIFFFLTCKNLLESFWSLSVWLCSGLLLFSLLGILILNSLVTWLGCKYNLRSYHNAISSFSYFSHLFLKNFHNVFFFLLIVLFWRLLQVLPELHRVKEFLFFGAPVCYSETYLKASLVECIYSESKIGKRACF